MFPWERVPERVEAPAPVIMIMNVLFVPGSPLSWTFTVNCDTPAPTCPVPVYVTSFGPVCVNESIESETR